MDKKWFGGAEKIIDVMINIYMMVRFGLRHHAKEAWFRCH